MSAEPTLDHRDAGLPQPPAHVPHERLRHLRPRRGEEVRAMEKEGLDPATILQKIKAGGSRPTPDAVDEIRRIAAKAEVEKSLVDSLTASKDQVLPPLEEGDALDLKELLPDQHFTEPPPRYSEASLVKALEKFGIGRPSTYAPIKRDASSKRKQLMATRRDRSACSAGVRSTVLARYTGAAPSGLTIGRSAARDSSIDSTN